jgi:serine/threonine-protein kinase
MAALEPGATFGPFRLIEPLGRGGMASVWKAYEAGLDRYIALKVLPPEFLHEETFAARFQREAKVIAKLEHPNIVPIFAFGIEQGIPWMAMRLVAGGSLYGLLKQGRLARDRAVGIIRSVADALTYAHAGSVVHRDVKPQNILLDEQGRVYLADFGIARMVEGGAAITRTGLVSGTPQYMSPEQATGHSLDHRVDIYALGIVAYELFTGSTPFSADTPVAVLLKQVSAPIPIPAKELVPEALLGPLMKSLAKNPDERWQTAAEFATAIERGMGIMPTAAAAAVPPLPAMQTPPHPTPLPLPITTTSQRAAVPRRAGSSLATAAVVGGLALLALVGVGAFGVWVWPRGEGPTLGPTESSPPSPGPVTPPPTLPALSSPPPALPAKTGLAPIPSPHPPQTTPRGTPEPGAGVPPTLAPATPPPTLAASPPTAPPTTTPTPGKPADYPFGLNEKILVGSTVHPVELRQARFLRSKPDELESQLEFHCAKGKDQAVTYELTLLDENGNEVLNVKGRETVEEKDKATFKPKRKVVPGQVESIKSFRVTFTTEPD